MICRRSGTSDCGHWSACEYPACKQYSPIPPPDCPTERRTGDRQGLALTMKVAGLTALSILVLFGLVFWLAVATVVCR